MAVEITISLPRRQPYRSLMQFRIWLIGTDPAVWRRIQVPDYYTFYDLHVAIQDAMGWLDKHLHDFVIKPKSRANLGIRIESPFGLDDLEDPAPVLTTEVAVADFIEEPGDEALYTYDYGDGWQHEVKDNSEGLLDWLGRWRPDRFDPAKVKFWSPLRRLKIALED